MLRKISMVALTLMFACTLFAAQKSIMKKGGEGTGGSTATIKGVVRK